MCKIHLTSKSCALLYWQRYCTALEQWASAKFAAFSRERHLYSAGRPSRWASARILVALVLFIYYFCLVPRRRLSWLCQLLGAHKYRPSASYRNSPLSRTAYNSVTRLFPAYHPPCEIEEVIHDLSNSGYCDDLE